MTSSHTSVQIDCRDAVLRIAFDQSATLNALNPPTLQAVAESVERASADPAVRAILITGTGRAFSSGADIGAGGLDSEDDDLIESANRLVVAIREAPKPVLAAVNGAAAGAGASLALAADLVIARESAYFLLAFTNIGLMPDAGATALVPSAVGRMRANRMALLAERVPARTAWEWGLISRVTADETFDTEVEELVMRLATGPTAAYARTKAAFNRTTVPALREALDFELSNQSELLAAEDFAEGVRAFREGRKPKFTGR